MSAAPAAGRTRARRAYVAGYTLLSLLLHAAWEAGQLPLYTIWADGAPAALRAAAHCTLGDAVIALATLAVAVLATGGAAWPVDRQRRVAALAIALGVAYTVFSEWLNVEVRGTWAYAAAMPRVPPLGTGLAPLLQWLVVPALAFVGAARTARRAARPPV